jgi:hypothetical protein
VKKKRGKAPRRTFRVFCVLGDGRVSGDCGHAHRSQLAAVRCPYEPRAYKRDARAALRIAPHGGPR